MNNLLVQVARKAAKQLDLVDWPTSLIKRIENEMELLGVGVEDGEVDDLLSGLQDADPFLGALGLKIHGWDEIPTGDAEWTGSTEPKSAARRKAISDALGLSQAQHEILLKRRPIFSLKPDVISGEWEPWYPRSRSGDRNFYWSHYRSYLERTRGWGTQNVDSLDTASTLVVERLADPTQKEAYRSKGLVVGYVQSGKTANFTGVIAKAIDAGYRLVIVMTGTIELLRSQTQRRLDMELIGKQNIRGSLPDDERDDYQFDESWPDFQDFDDAIPTEIIRLTTEKSDYKKQFKTLRIRRTESGRPLFSEENLFRADARIAIVKKNSTVLKKLVSDIRANENEFKEIPVLIIDDEADQASVNTVNPALVAKKKAAGETVAERKAVNQAIADMQKYMPRAQYIGYTATPFANVFVDPKDELSIFPKDFVIGLDRPNGYMGVDDFIDLEPIDDESGQTSLRNPYVRSLWADDTAIDDQDAELAKALDLFVLTGMVKLWREKHDQSGKTKFRHHTMLVHESTSRAAHKELADRVREQWRSNAYSAPRSVSRLKDLYEEELVTVSSQIVEDGVLPPPDWDTASHYLGEAIQKIGVYKGDPVIIVNSDTDLDQQDLNFERNEIWRVLVGGTKLSRGFTVEGLTITYFRRATNLSDTLTQMGRWFGFRAGYRDLVRLFIARRATYGRREWDLLEAFRGIAHAESAFREQLSTYALAEDGKSRVTPEQIPPLVQQHLPWLRPTARNKMYHTRLISQVKQPLKPFGIGWGPDANEENWRLWEPILGHAGKLVDLPTTTGTTTYKARVGLVSAKDLVRVLEDLDYIGNYLEAAVEPILGFYRDVIQQDELTEFLLVLPQMQGEAQEVAIGTQTTKVVKRERMEQSLFTEYTAREHRGAIEQFVGRAAPPAIKEFESDSTGAALIYVMNDSKDDEFAKRVPDDEDSYQAGPDCYPVGIASYVPSRLITADRSVPIFQVPSSTEDDGATT